jgi:hypothetical protein
VGQFIYVIRKRIKLPSEKAIFIFVGNYVPPQCEHRRCCMLHDEGRWSDCWRTWWGVGALGAWLGPQGLYLMFNG